MLRLFNNLVRQLAVSAHELVSHVLKLLFFSLKLLLDLLVALFALKNELSQVEPRIDVGLLQLAERVVRRDKFDQLRDVWLVLQWARVHAILLQTVAPQVLECHLHVVHCILVVHLIEEELLQLEQLIALNILDLFLATYMAQFLNGRRELEVDKGVDAI